MSLEPVKIKALKPLKDYVMVSDMNFQERVTSTGIIIPSDNGKTQGIRPRWAQVYAVGPEQQDVRVGDWICVAHGRWTRGTTIEDSNGVHTVRRIDTNDILLVSDEQPSDDTMSDAIHGNAV
jgi:co-chaperonin GroES (HSP10)